MTPLGGGVGVGPKDIIGKRTPRGPALPCPVGAYSPDVRGTQQGGWLAGWAQETPVAVNLQGLRLIM